LPILIHFLRSPPTGPFSDAAAFRSTWLAPLCKDPARTLYHIVVKSQDTFQVGNETHSGTPAGTIGLLNTDPANRATELGYILIDPAWQRTFVSTHAIGLLLGYALEDLQLRRVAWQCNAVNGASRRAAERMGFVLEARLRWARVLRADKEGNGRSVRGGELPGRDSFVLSITWEDWATGGTKQHVERLMGRPVAAG
jgi:RimJ/RimL family protein N-acetyltransferase